jgi:hypothetical protein
MRGAGVAPTAVTFNTLMDACLARGAPAAVPRMFRALLAARLAPDAASYTTLVAAFARLGRPDDAVRAAPRPATLLLDQLSSKAEVEKAGAVWCVSCYSRTPAHYGKKSSRGLACSGWRFAKVVRHTHVPVSLSR